MYRDSLHTFDSPQLCGRRPHCLQRRYLSHCSWINMPGLWARWYSSSSRSLLRFTLAAQESSRERRASKRSWCRRARSKMILQENGEDINIPNVVNKLKSSKPNNYITGIVLVVHHSKYRRLKMKIGRNQIWDWNCWSRYTEGSLTMYNPLVCWVTNCEWMNYWDVSVSRFKLIGLLLARASQINK